MRVVNVNVSEADIAPDDGEQAPLLTHAEGKALLAAVRDGRAEAVVSLNLGRSETTVRIEQGAARIGTAALPAAALAKIAGDPNKCFRIVDGEPQAAALFSATTGWTRSLLPTNEAPTTLVAGFTMHRIRGTTPLADTRAKVRALRGGRGRVLDTATGLGYTAIELARTGRQVLTVELDPSAIDLARLNPWSRGLFANPNIEIIIGDVAELAAGWETGTFSAVLHDPPTMQLAGALYSGAFYRQLRRVLKPGGRLFHYVGDPQSGMGAKTTTGVVRRLQEAGFENVRRHAPAFGVTAVASRGRGGGLP